MIRSIVLATAAVCLLGTLAIAAVPTSITVQGKLTDTLGAPLPGSTQFVFRIFSDTVGGTELWPGGMGEVQAIPVSIDGLWIAMVGTHNPLNDLVFTDPSVWLGITAGGTMLPRVRLATGPFAFRVATLDGASGGSITSKVSIGPGHSNTGIEAFVAGANNQAAGNYCAVGGGFGNLASGAASKVGGGQANLATGERSVIGGGGGNFASGSSATIPGGSLNVAYGENSFAAGLRANALHAGSFVWSIADTGFSSAAPNQFLINASGGVGMGTNAPSEQLHVAGNIRAGGFIPMGISTEVNALINLDGNFRMKINDLAPGGAFRIDTRSPFGPNQLFNWFSRAAGSAVEVPRMVLTEAGNLGIGETNPSQPLQMASGAFVSVTGTWTNASSRSYKTDIQSLNKSEYSEILEKLEDVDVVRFRYKKDPARLHLGLIAEDVPDEMASDDRTGVPTADAIAFLLAALKAQQTQIDELKSTIKSMTP